MMSTRRNPALVGALALLAASWCPPATVSAQGGGGTCAISVTGVNFGTYNVFSGTPVQSTGGITFRCGPKADTNPVRISLSTGQSGTFHSRTLAQGGETLAYNLFRDAARTEIWGDGSSATFDVPMAPERNTWVPVTIYAEIPASQDVSAGSYSDTVTATINF